MKTKKLICLICAAVLLAAASLGLSSCDINRLPGEYKLKSVVDSDSQETLESYEYYKLSLTVTTEKREKSQRYQMSYKKKNGESGLSEGDWVYEKKDFSFIHTQFDDLSDSESWDKKSKTITLVRYDGARVRTYEFILIE
ncbi:MAG: hypothetical protein LBQ40_07490 [Clostridiales bacterium]|jgi:hypothetical protein|nr:hypothetical protein [Clostridiales bacterium]